MKKLLILLVVITLSLPVTYFFIESNRQIAYCKKIVDNVDSSEYSQKFLDIVKSKEWERSVLNQVVGDSSVYQGFIGREYNGKINVVFSDTAGDIYYIERAEISDDYFLKAEKAISETCEDSLVDYFDYVSDAACSKLTISGGHGSGERVYVSPYASSDNCQNYKAVNQELYKLYSDHKQKQIEIGGPRLEPIIKPTEEDTHLP